MGSEFRSQYDKKRNFAPLPTMQQLYKNEKFWSEKENIVKPEMGRLKEQFSQQLQQIWNVSFVHYVPLTLWNNSLHYVRDLQSAKIITFPNLISLDLSGRDKIEDTDSR